VNRAQYRKEAVLKRFVTNQTYRPRGWRPSNAKTVMTGPKT